MPIDLIDEIIDNYMENKLKFETSNFAKSAYLLKKSIFLIK